MDESSIELSQPAFKVAPDALISGRMMLETLPAGEFTLKTLEAAFTDILGRPRPTQRAFLDRVLEDFRPGELLGVGVKDLASVLADFWTFACERTGVAPTVRLIRAAGVDGRELGFDLLEIVQPDAPFLVDSVMGEVSESGADVKAMFHPVVDEGAGRTSMIQVWLAPVGEERRAGLIERVLAAMADVHAAVGDFPAMLELLSHTIEDLERAAPLLGDRLGPEVVNEDLAFLRWIDAGHFVFLGARVYDYPRTPDGDYAAEEPTYDPERGLGVLRDPERLVLRRSSEPLVLASTLRWRTDAAAPSDRGQGKPPIPRTPSRSHGLCRRSAPRRRGRSGRRDPVHRPVHGPGL